MTRGRRTVRTALAFGLAVLPLLGASVAGLAQEAGADSIGPSFTGLANAYGVDLTVANGSLPLGLTPEGAGPVAQASLNSIGNSDAFASFPYLGDTANGLPGLAGALVGLPIPQYPLYVATASGDSPKDQGVPGIALHAESGASEASSKAVVGTDSAGFTSTSRVEILADGDVQASASTTFGVNLLNLISLSGVESSATVVANASTGAITRQTHLSIGEFSIPGLNLAIPGSTPTAIPIPIPVPGLPQLPPLTLPPLPLPFGGTTLLEPDIGFEDGTFTLTLPGTNGALKFAIPAAPVLSAFKALGITITYQTPQDMATGVVGPVLTIGYTVPSLPSNKVFNGPTPVQFSLGRSTASVTLHPVGASLGSGTDGTGTVGTGSTGTTSGTGAGTGAVGTSSGGGGDLGGGISLPSIGSGTGDLASAPGSVTDSGGTGLAGAGSSTSGSPNVALRTLAYSDVSSADLSGLYLTCIGLAAVAGIGCLVLRLMGVQLRWRF